MRALPAPLLLLALSLLAASSAAARPGAPTPATDPPALQLSIASLQLPQAQDPLWEQRREQIVQALEALRPDVVTIQHVQQRDGRSPACWLARRLRYSCDFVTVDPPSQALRHGNAMLSRLPVTEDGLTLLHPPGRYSAAGMMRVQVGSQEVNVYVARLRPEPDTAASRQHQANDLMTWVAATSNGLPSVVVGDFAAASGELVRSTPGFQPSRRNPSARMDRASGTAQGGRDAPAAHGLDVLFQVKHFSGLREQHIDLPAQGELAAARLGMLAVLELQAGDAAQR